MPQTLAACIKQKRKMCKAFGRILESSELVVDLLKEVEMTSDTPMVVADMYDNILKLHNECRGNYGRVAVEDDMDATAEDLEDAITWVRAEASHYKDWEKEKMRKIQSGDTEALEDILSSAYDAITGQLPEERQSIIDAIKELDEEDKDEGDEDGLW